MNIEDSVAMLSALRGKKAELNAAHDERIKLLNRGIADLEVKIRAALNVAGLTQARTVHGLVTLIQERKYHVADWSPLYDHIRATGNFGLLQRRLGDGATKEYIGEHGNAPPGVSFTDIISVNFTKPKD